MSWVALLVVGDAAERVWILTSVHSMQGAGNLGSFLPAEERPSWVVGRGGSQAAQRLTAAAAALRRSAPAGRCLRAAAPGGAAAALRRSAPAGRCLRVLPPGAPRAAAVAYQAAQQPHLEVGPCPQNSTGDGLIGGPRCTGR